MSAANWQLSVPTRSVDDDGAVKIIARVTDQTTGQAGTVTLTLTPGRQLLVLVDGLELDDFAAWSTT